MTNSLSNKEAPKFDPAAADAMEKLASLFEVYSDTTERMQHAYDQLQSEVLRLRHELEQKNEQLERKSRLAALGEMAAGIAHEIRNPLGAVQLYASLLERDLESAPDQSQWARKISHGIRTVDQIVSDVMAFSQDQQCVVTSFHLADLLAEVLELIAPEERQKRRYINTRSIDKNFVMEGDVHLLRRVFLNLIRNAMDETEDRGQIDIEAEHLSEGEYAVRITVADSGPGIAPDVMEKMFNPFYTTKETGMGLGLAIVHRAIECQGGIITAANKRVGGALFTIQLPGPNRQGDH
jgi:two-component system sensor histidine kinase FlrB